MYLSRNQHAESLFDDRRPWYQAEPNTIIAADGQHADTEVDCCCALQITQAARIPLPIFS